MQEKEKIKVIIQDTRKLLRTIRMLSFLLLTSWEG